MNKSSLFLNTVPTTVDPEPPVDAGGVGVHHEAVLLLQVAELGQVAPVQPTRVPRLLPWLALDQSELTLPSRDPASSNQSSPGPRRGSGGRAGS